MTDAPSSSETPIKRRLSLRVNTDQDEKRFKTEVNSHVRPPSSAEQINENDPPVTATSSRFIHQSTSSYSSPTSSVTGEEREGEPELRPESRGQLTPSRIRFNVAFTRSAAWQSQSLPQHPSTRGSRRQTTASVAASRQTSPPSFSLSSGEPLVNPPPKTQNAFVGKLYSILEDEDVTKSGLLYWSGGGTSFTCPNPTEFARDVLPRYYKHNNWQSFVRQLNMYSFNKVNEVSSSSSDPHAWEFRHPLFRQGEAHLLASIKRKPSRPSNQDDSQLVSPSDDIPDNSRAMPGWIREGRPMSANAMVSPQGMIMQQQHNQTSRGELPLSARLEGSRPNPFGSMWERSVPQQQPQPQPIPPGSTTQQHQQGLSRSEPQSGPVRFHPEGNRPSLRYHSTGSFPPGSPLYPQPSQPSTVDALSGQLAILEDRIQRLAEMMKNDRIEHVRSKSEFTSHILRVLEHATGPHSSQEIRSLQETLSRQNTELRQKYEEMVHSNTLTVIPGGLVTAREREHDPDDRRGRGQDRDGSQPFNIMRSSHLQPRWSRPSAPGQVLESHSRLAQSQLHDGSSAITAPAPALAQSSHDTSTRTSPRPASTASGFNTTSNSFSSSNDPQTQTRPSTSNSTSVNSRDRDYYPTPIHVPVRLGRSSNPNTNGITLTSRYEPPPPLSHGIGNPISTNPAATASATMSTPSVPYPSGLGLGPTMSTSTSSGQGDPPITYNHDHRQQRQRQHRSSISTGTSTTDNNENDKSPKRTQIHLKNEEHTNGNSNMSIQSQNQRQSQNGGGSGGGGGGGEEYKGKAGLRNLLN